MVAESELEIHGLRVRVMRCDCKRNCRTRYILANDPEREALWLCIGYANGAQAVSEALEEYESSIEHLDVTLHGIGLVGATWAQIGEKSDQALKQNQIWESIPDWMDRLDLDLVWRTRRAVFGNDLTRVPNALMIAHAFYDAGGSKVGPDDLRDLLRGAE